MTREEAIERIEFLKGVYSVDMETALGMAIEALKANNVETDNIVRISVADRKKDKVILYDAFGENEYYPKQTTPTIPCFTESAEAYKAWTGEEMDGASEKQNVAYICDKRRCGKEGCSNCGRTTDIEHAKNFELINNTYYERW